MSDTKLRPCPNPWCESKAEYVEERGIWFIVVCEYCGNRGPARKSRGDAIAAWNTRPAPTLTPKQAAADEVAKAAKALADAMETCHECKGTVLVDEQPTHCEDCSSFCDSHEGSECATIYGLHLELKRTIAVLAKAGRP